MREIKFRGLDSEGNWHYGNLLQSKPFKDGRIDCWIQPKSLLCLGAISTPTSSFVKVIEKTVGQFIGIKDESGAEVFEGDELKTDTVNQYVVYREDMTLFCMRVNKFSGTTSIPAACEVIGNIHQSPWNFGE